MDNQYKFYDKSNLGIERNDMPQISEDNLDDFLLHFADKVKVSKLKMCIDLIKPTQNAINEDKVLKMISDEYDWKARKYIISSDKYLLDGHHAYAVGLELEPDCEVVVYRVNLKINELLKRTKKLKIATKLDLQDNLVKSEVLCDIVESGCIMVTDLHLEEQLQYVFDEYGFEKAIPSHLIKKVIINKKGHAQTVWIDPGKKDGTKFDFNKYPYKGTNPQFIFKVENAIEEVLKKKNIDVSVTKVKESNDSVVEVVGGPKDNFDKVGEVEWYKTKNFNKTGIIGIKHDGKIHEKKIKDHEKEIANEKKYLEEIETKRKKGEEIADKVIESVKPDSGLSDFGGFKVGDFVKFKDGDKERVGKIKGIKHHEKYDKFGTALIEDDDTGQVFSRSLKKLEKLSKTSEESSKIKTLEDVFNDDTQGILDIDEDIDYTPIVKKFEHPDMENPVYSVKIGNTEKFIQRMEGDYDAWYEVAKDSKDGSWYYADGKPYFESQSLLGYTKKEAVEKLSSIHGKSDDDNGKTLSEAMKGNQNAKKDNVAPEPETYKFIKNLGGSNGAKLVEDKNGQQWVEKVMNSDRAANEYFANKLYESFGISVPEVKLEGNSLLSKYIPGLQTLGEFWDKSSIVDKGKISKQIKDGFVADALLSNWDVIGLNQDNIMIDPETKKIYRIDNGGSLAYRAQGALKGDDFNEKVIELETFLDKKVNPQTSKFFNSVTDEQKAEQIKNILDNKILYLSTAEKFLDSSNNELSDYGLKMIKRLSYLETLYNKDIKQSAVDEQYFPGGIYKKTGDADIDKIYKEIDALMTISPADKEYINSNSYMKTFIQEAVYWKKSNSDNEWIKKATEVGVSAEEMYVIKQHTGSYYTEFNNVLKNTTNSIAGNINPKLLTITAEEVNTSGKIIGDIHPKDSYWNPILSTIKTINHHKEDKNFNVNTIQDFHNNYGKINSVLEDIKNHPESYSDIDKKMIKYYKKLSFDINSALIKSKKQVIEIPKTEQYKIEEKDKIKFNNNIDKENGKGKTKKDSLKIKTKLDEFENEHQRNNLIKVKLLANGISKLEKSGKFQYKGAISRKIDFNKLDSYSEGDSIVKQHHDGAHVIWQRVNSCSKNFNVWEGNMKFNIVKHNGVDIEGISHHQSEKEVLLKPFTLIKVNKIVKNYSNNYSVEVEQIG